MKPNGTIHIVMGVSSAGKSSYIRAMTEREKWESNIPILLASEIEEGICPLPRGDCVIHYSLFRPFDNEVSNVGSTLLENATS